MAKVLPRPWTVEDFLAFEAEEVEPCELVGGIVRVMTGRSAAHSTIKGNIALALRDSLPEPCRAYVSDPRVVTATAVMYPDVQVVCRRLDPDDDRVADPRWSSRLSRRPRSVTTGSTSGASIRRSARCSTSF